MSEVGICLNCSLVDGRFTSLISPAAEPVLFFATASTVCSYQLPNCSLVAGCFTYIQCCLLPSLPAVVSSRVALLVSCWCPADSCWQPTCPHKVASCSCPCSAACMFTMSLCLLHSCLFHTTSWPALLVYCEPSADVVATCLSS
jgi:hypothetical protein